MDPSLGVPELAVQLPAVLVLPATAEPWWVGVALYVLFPLAGILVGAWLSHKSAETMGDAQRRHDLDRDLYEAITDAAVLQTSIWAAMDRRESFELGALAPARELWGRLDRMRLRVQAHRPECNELYERAVYQLALLADFYEGRPLRDLPVPDSQHEHDLLRLGSLPSHHQELLEKKLKVQLPDRSAILKTLQSELDARKNSSTASPPPDDPPPSA